MLTFKVTAAQGEITIKRLNSNPKKLPQGFTPLKAEGGKFVIGHSETGHHHVIDAKNAEVGVLDNPPDGMKILYMILQDPASLDHLRDHDTHESIRLEPGEYEIRIAREYDHYKELARQSAD